MRNFIRLYLPMLAVYLLLTATAVGWVQWKRYSNWATSKEPAPNLEAAIQAGTESNGPLFPDTLRRSAEGTVLFDKPTEPTERMPDVLRILDISAGEPPPQANR